MKGALVLADFAICLSSNYTYDTVTSCFDKNGRSVNQLFSYPGLVPN